MAFNLPSAQYLMNSNASTNRGSFDTGFQLGQKTAGNLPITSNAAQVTNSGGSEGIYFGLDSQGSTSSQDASTNTKVLLSSVQFNAPNRIQVDTIGNRGVVARLTSGSGGTNYKEYRIGGNDTPFASAQAGPVTICLDLSASGEDSTGGTYDNADATGWGYGTTKANLAGSNSSLCFFQRVFLFDTEKNGANLPTFTGTSNFDQALAVIQGSDYTTKIGAWLTKSGSSFFLPIPFSFGDGASAVNFDDQGVAVVSPANNATGQENFRLTNDAMRVYLDTRNDAADTVNLSGSYSWGTAAPWDFSQSNDGSATLSGNFTGMGEFTLGSSVTASGTFSLATGSDVVVQGANINTATINGNCRLEGSTVTTLTGVTITGSLDFDTAGTYTLDGCTINELTNSSGGAITINLTGGTTITTNTGPSITIEQNVVISAANLIDDTRVQIYNVTKDAEIDNSIVTGGAGYTFPVNLSSASVDVGDTIRLRATYQSGASAKLPLLSTSVIAQSGLSFIDSQVDDTIYNDIAIDGSTVTKFVADFTNDEIDLTTAVDFTGQELYARFVHITTSEDGVRDFFQGFNAINAANFENDVSVVDLFINNNTTSNIKQTDNVRIYKSNGVYPVKNPTTGGGGIDVVWRNQIFIAETNVSGLTPSESDQLNSIDKLTKLIPATL